VPGYFVILFFEEFFERRGLPSAAPLQEMVPFTVSASQRDGKLLFFNRNQAHHHRYSTHEGHAPSNHLLSYIFRKTVHRVREITGGIERARASFGLTVLLFCSLKNYLICNQ